MTVTVQLGSSPQTAGTTASCVATLPSMRPLGSRSPPVATWVIVVLT